MKRSKFSEEQVAYALTTHHRRDPGVEVIAPPYRTAGGRIGHARFQRIDQPDSWYEIGTFPKRSSVERTTAEEGK